MNNEQRDTLLIEMHGDVQAMHTQVKTNATGITELKKDVKAMSGNKWQIKGLYAVWSFVVAALGVLWAKK